MQAHPHPMRRSEPVETFTIGALAEAAGVHVETVRFYQRKGLMDLPNRPAGGIRRYGVSDVARLRFIKSAQRMGFSLDEAAELLALDNSAACAQARRQAGRKLADVRERLTELQRMETELQKLVDRCDEVAGRLDCPVLDALYASHANQSNR